MEKQKVVVRLPWSMKVKAKVKMKIKKSSKLMRNLSSKKLPKSKLFKCKQPLKCKLKRTMRN